MPFPPKDLQDSLAEKLCAVSNAINAANNHLQNLNKLRKEMLMKFIRVRFISVETVPKAGKNNRIFPPAFADR